MESAIKHDDVTVALTQDEAFISGYRHALGFRTKFSEPEKRAAVQDLARSALTWAVKAGQV